MRKMFSKNQIKEISGEITESKIDTAIEDGKLSSKAFFHFEVEFDDQDPEMTVEGLYDKLKKYRLVYLKVVDGNDRAYFEGLVSSTNTGNPHNYMGIGKENNDNFGVSITIDSTDNMLIVYTHSGSSSIFYESTYDIDLYPII